MLRVFSAIIVLLILSFTVILFTGLASDPNYEKTMSALYDDRVSVVWDVLTDVEKYPQSKIDIERVEIMERRFNLISEWKEVVSAMESREYEIIERDTPKLLILKMKNTRTGTEGVWTYKLFQEGDKTKLFITEESTTENIIWRGWDTLIGRHHRINYEFKWLRVKLFEELLLK